MPIKKYMRSINLIFVLHIVRSAIILKKMKKKKEEVTFVRMGNSRSQLHMRMYKESQLVTVYSLVFAVGGGYFLMSAFRVSRWEPTGRY